MSHRCHARFKLVEKRLIEFNTAAMQRSDFKKTDDMFNRVLGKDQIGIACNFEVKESGSRIIVANTHIHWDPQFRDVKLVQVALLIEEIENISHNFAKYPPRLAPTASTANGPTAGDNNGSSRPPPVYSDGTKIPVIVCGDFNSLPSSGVYEFLSTGAVPPNHPDFMSHTYGKYTSDGLRHKLGLQSAYSVAGEIPMTNFTPTFRGVIDYIWFSTANLQVNAVLGEIDKAYLEKVVGFPNPHYPSECVLFILHDYFVLTFVILQSYLHRRRVPCKASQRTPTSPTTTRLPRLRPVMCACLFFPSFHPTFSHLASFL